MSFPQPNGPQDPYTSPGYATPAAPGQAPQPPAYQQPMYGPPRTNTLAIVGFVLAFVFSPAGLICSLIGLKQIKETGESGHGLALAGAILSGISVALFILWLIVTVIAVGAQV